jgi:hypothetical protein
MVPVSDFESEDAYFDGSALAAAFEDAVRSCEPNLPGLVAGAVDRSQRARRHRMAWQVAGSAFLVAAVGAGTALVAGGTGGGRAVAPASGASGPATLPPEQPPMVGIERTRPVALSLVPAGVTALADPERRNNDVIVGDGGPRSALLTVIMYPDSRPGAWMKPSDLDCAKTQKNEPDIYCSVQTLPNGDTVQVTGGPSAKYPGEIVYTVLRLTPDCGLLDLSEDLTAPAGTSLPISLDQLTAMAESSKWTPLF